MSYLLTTTLTGWKGGAHVALWHKNTALVMYATGSPVVKIKFNNVVKGLGVSVQTTVFACGVIFIPEKSVYSTVKLFHIYFVIA